MADKGSSSTVVSPSPTGGDGKDASCSTYTPIHNGDGILVEGANSNASTPKGTIQPSPFVGDSPVKGSRDTETDDGAGDTHLVVKRSVSIGAASNAEIPVIISPIGRVADGGGGIEDSKHVRLSYSFKSMGGDIGFSVVLQLQQAPQSLGESNKTIILLESKRYQAHKSPIVGALDVPAHEGGGILLIQFDNTYSLLTGKTVAYKLDVQFCQQNMSSSSLKDIAEKKKAIDLEAQIADRIRVIEDEHRREMAELRQRIQGLVQVNTKTSKGLKVSANIVSRMNAL